MASPLFPVRLTTIGICTSSEPACRYLLWPHWPSSGGPNCCSLRSAKHWLASLAFLQSLNSLNFITKSSKTGPLNHIWMIFLHQTGPGLFPSHPSILDIGISHYFHCFLPFIYRAQPRHVIIMRREWVYWGTELLSISSSFPKHKPFQEFFDSGHFIINFV